MKFLIFYIGFIPVYSLQLFVITDGPKAPKTDQSYSRLQSQWKKVTNWLEAIFFQLSLGVKNDDTTFISSVQAKQTRVSHCFGPRNCQNKVSQLRIPSWDTYSTFEVLADHISTKNKYGKKVMIFITDGLLGFDTEANCTKLNSPDFPDLCRDLFVDSLQSRQHYKRLRTFDLVLLLSWDPENKRIPKSTEKMMRELLGSTTLVTGYFSSASGPTLMHLLEIKAAELENVQSDPERAQSAKLLENKSQH